LDARNQLGQVHGFVPAPGIFEQGGEEDVLSAAHGVCFDAGQPEQGRHCTLDALAERLALSVPVQPGRVEAAYDADRQAGFGAWGVDCEIRRRLQRSNAISALIPARQAFAPQLGLCGRELLRREPLAPRIVHVDPRQEILGQQVREGEQEVRDVAFRIDEQGRHVVQRCLLQQIQAQTGFAAARHPDTDGMRCQVSGIIVDRCVQ